MKQLEPEKDYTVELGLDEPDDATAIAARLARDLGTTPSAMPPLEVRKRSIDARHGRVRFHVVVGAVTSGELGGAPVRDVTGEPVIVVGGGPAGLFCAYELARAGIRSIVIDRGKPVQARRRDLKGLTQHGRVDPDSNYCFGEGGAGTYSDGKLYTRSHKRGDIRDVIEILAVYGAPHEILVDARPHIGSNKLPKVITAIRERLEKAGCEFRFGARVTELVVRDGKAIGVRLGGGELLGRAVVLATGHSARDVHDLLQHAGVRLEAKPFAMGVRIEHPQPLIDRMQYGRAAGHVKLPAAPYKLAFTPADGRGAFSFCMCPGGWIVPAATEPDGVVVNGMSLSRRDSPYANSGLVVAISLEDLQRLGLTGPLGGVELQRRLERAAAIAGGGDLRAPATRATDFVRGKASSTVPATSYEPGLAATDVGAVLDATGLPLAQRLREALPVFDKQMRGYLTEEAVLVGVESRTSSPVRVPRDQASLQSPDVAALYPCGEGAGFAGGIVSAALDGIRVARAIVALAREP
ncbi:MAG: NAD(P)/FAD-dependent oxidoreductase [Deltaproteobacteria bacterium]|nr:NAD(P)/FAD-dependent oxidoreductase [Deltaproteobacteria bacterium]